MNKGGKGSGKDLFRDSGNGDGGKSGMMPPDAPASLGEYVESKTPSVTLGKKHP